jgi:pilus assembly protein CpaB
VARQITNVASGSNRNRAVLMLAAIFGILSAALMFAFLNSRGGSDTAAEQVLNNGKAATVVVAAQDIPAGTTILQEMVTVKSLPASALLTGYISEESLVVGQITSAPIYIGEQVITAKVTKTDAQNTLASKIGPGEKLRALALVVPHEAWIVGGLPQPGDRVDVVGITTLVTVDPLTGQERPDFLTGIIGENLEVLAVSQKIIKVTGRAPAGNVASALATPSATPGTEGLETIQLDTGETFATAISITLAADYEVASKIASIDALRDDVGQYRVILRGTGNGTEIKGTKTWSIADVFAPKK